MTPPPPPPANPPKPPVLPSPLDAIPDMRATAKWILGAAAAVGAALVGGAPLTAVGKVHGAGHIALAYAGLVVGLAGVGWAIWRTADALIPPLITRLSLDSEPGLAGLRAKIAGDPRSFYGPFGTSMAELQRTHEYHQRMARILASAAAAETSPDRKRVMEAQAQAAQATVTAARTRVQNLLELAYAWQVRAELRDARLHALLGAAVAAAGAVLFLVSTG